jgi:hypothetical protein
MVETDESLREWIMPDDNSHNLLYFEGASMRELFDRMDDRQKTHRKRLLSTHVERDAGMFCCIALTNPMEVIIIDGGGGDRAQVYEGSLDGRT